MHWRQYVLFFFNYTKNSYCDLILAERTDVRLFSSVINWVDKVNCTLERLESLWRRANKALDEGLTLETSAFKAFKLFTVANLRYQFSW